MGKYFVKSVGTLSKNTSDACVISGPQEKVAQTACMSACKYIANAMMEYLTDNEVKSISMGALMQVNLDLLQCERESSFLLIYLI